MDKRFNTLSVPEQLLLRKQAVDDVLAHPEWSLAQAVRHLKKTMRLTAAEMAKLRACPTGRCRTSSRNAARGPCNR